MSNPIRDLFSFVDRLGVPSMMQTEVGGGFEDTVKVQVPSRVLVELRRLIADPPKDAYSMRRIDDLTLDEMRKALRDLQTWCYLDGEFWRLGREIGATDTVDCLLGVLDDLMIAPTVADEEKIADPVEYKDYL